MNVSTELILPILETQAALASEEHRTWSLTFKPKTVEWTQTDMKDAIRLFQKTDYKENVYEEELIVESEADGTSFHVNGIHNISIYCEHENPQTATGKWYKYATIQDTTTDQLPDLFSLKVMSRVKEERPLEDKQTPQNWGSSMKKYELNKKIIYTDLKTDVRYIISMTKRAPSTYPTMIASNVSALPPLIEYSIECPPDMDPKDVIIAIVRMIQILEQNSRPMTLEQQKAILDNYDSLVDKVREKKKYMKDPYYLAPKPVTLEQVHLSEPSITYGQLTILDGYAVTDKADGERMLLFINDNGEAYMINNTFEVRGTGWKVKRDILHNTLLDGEYLPASKRRDKSDQDLFAIFDVYFVGGESVMGLPLMKTKPAPATPTAASTATEQVTKIELKPITAKQTIATKTTKTIKKAEKEDKIQITGDTRVDIMNSVLNQALWEHDKDTQMEIMTKVHIAANRNEMFVACRKILEDAVKKGSPYDIDGLIFTPIDLPVLGYYPNKPIKIKSMGSTWDRVLKWKPPQQNSIDFAISIDKNTVKDIKHHRNYAKLTLSCGYSALRNEEISVSRGLELLQTPISKRALGDDYILKAFTPQHYYQRDIQYAYIPFGADNILRAENGDEITDGAVVEFGYDINDRRPISYRWRALRVRNDKMRNIITPTPTSADETGLIPSASEQKQGENKSKKKEKYQLKTLKVNDWKTATGIWKSIHEPVTREMITGVVRAPELVKKAIDLESRLLGSDAVYYGRNVTREHLLSVDMLNFHNNVIKSNLYTWRQSSPKNNLLELACGMAGDLNRWQNPRTGLSFVNILGVDLVRDNITKAVDGAYARVLAPRWGGDGAQRKHQNYVFVIGDCAKQIRNGECSRGIDKDSEDVLKELYGKPTSRRLLSFIPPFATRGFNMVSCQFAIHYFFEKKTKLEGFMKNVRDNLLPGGLFITTFMDGTSVEKLIRDKGANGLVEGRKMDNKVVVWAIRRIRNTNEEDDNLEEQDDEQSEEEYQGGQAQSEYLFSGGATRRKTNLITVYEPVPNEKTKKQFDIVDVPALGDCMFISLELAAFGEEKSSRRNGAWMRARIIETLRDILSKDDEEALELYEEIRLSIDNMSSDVKEQASKLVSSELYDSSSTKSNYAKKLSGYLKWMSKERTWGREIELNMAMKYLKRPIYIYQTNTTTNKTKAHVIGEDLYPNKTPVRVWFNGQDHYKALMEPPSPSTVSSSSSAPSLSSSTASSSSPSPSIKNVTPVVEKEDLFGRLIDVYLENTNRLIPEYLVDFTLLCEYATRYGLELEQDGMFSDTYQAYKHEREAKNLPNEYPNFDKDIIQQQFSFLNRWAVFRRVSNK